MNDVPICKNCVHFSKGASFQFPEKCLRRRKFSLIVGGYVSPEYAEDERRRSWFSDTCGPKGKYFVAR